MNYPGKPTFIIETLGCKVNQYESQAMREELIRNGFIEEKSTASADFCIINSCTVTRKADKETRNLIRRFHKANPSGKIMIAGCYAEADEDRKALMDIPGVVGLIRNSEKERIVDLFRVRDAGRPGRGIGLKITSFENRNRAFVKAQDGCDHGCSYCKVSLVRGRSRSRHIEAITEEVEALVANGFKEIVLTGVCLGSWGRDFKERGDLTGLVKKICSINGKFRVRLSSIEPIYITDSLVNELKENEKLCKHLHMPLQSGDDKILKLMKRPYDTKKFRQIIKKIRNLIPEAAVTTDVLIGFPGEDEKRFLNTKRFIEEIKPSRTHIFSYSRREGTIAAGLGGEADKETLRKRVRILGKVARKLSLEFAVKCIGSIQGVVVEEARDSRSGLLTGYTDRYVRVLLLDGPDSLKNELISIRIINAEQIGHTTLAKGVKTPSSWPY